MLAKVIKNEGSLFIIKIIFVYLLWTLVRESFNNIPILEPIWLAFNDFFAARYVAISSWCLEHWFGYDLIYNKRNIIPKNSVIIYVGNHCLGISAKFIFTAIILSLKGRIRDKIWFIALGLGIIFLINFTRILMLAKQLTEGKLFLFDLNHKYIYVLFVYGIIFCMILIWEKYLANKKN